MEPLHALLILEGFAKEFLKHEYCSQQDAELMANAKSTLLASLEQLKEYQDIEINTKLLQP